MKTTYLDITEHYHNGKLHRIDGPAVEYQVTGDKFWYLKGEQVTAKDVLFKAIENNDIASVDNIIKNYYEEFSKND